MVAGTIAYGCTLPTGRDLGSNGFASLMTQVARAVTQPSLFSGG